MKYVFLVCIFIFFVVSVNAQDIFYADKSINSYPIATNNKDVVIYVDKAEEILVLKSAKWLQQDIEAVTGKKIFIVHELNQHDATIILIGTVGKSNLLQLLVKSKKINLSSIENKWESYAIQNIGNPFSHVNNMLVIAGNDRRGVAFGVFEVSKQMGVSPWYWWADVPIAQKQSLYINSKISMVDSPRVKYRGIFINDEAPALSSWSKEKFGGFNHLFYEKVFELMLRLKANYLWPAMWGNAFYDDDNLNVKAADDYGIVIGTSHHEPLMRAHDEWRRYGNGKWNYESNSTLLQEFWRRGVKRAYNEKIISIGMRGDGDEPMSEATATALLERIVKDQREIIASVTGKPANQTPQLWALYKEVQDYYDKGMRVPDDVTLLLCDDNWGNLRKLPKLHEAPRKGGYGIYYHFDYVGGPRNYKWINTNAIERVWEQMHLAYEYNAKQIWIVNVGDIKPMEFPISFFLDYAWNPTKIGPQDLNTYTEQWAAAQFGKKYAREIATIIATYTKYNSRRKPELLDAETYSLDNYGEADKVTSDYDLLLQQAESIKGGLPAKYLDAYFQLVLHPVKASANLHKMYWAVAKNKKYAAQKLLLANRYADTVKQLYLNDSLITLQYNKGIANGKWNHMMDQTHIGYTYWQQPDVNKMPHVTYISSSEVVVADTVFVTPSNSVKQRIPQTSTANSFFEMDGYISIEASHYTKAVHTKKITWIVLPNHGKTGDAITTFPVTTAEQSINSNAAHLAYDVYTYDTGKLQLQLYFSPTLNFHHNGGLKYAISIDHELPQIFTINQDDTDVKTWEHWVANNIIIKTTNHRIAAAGKHVIKYWMVSSGVVLQKIVANFGGVKPSYLGPPETRK